MDTSGNWSYKANNLSKIWRDKFLWVELCSPTSQNMCWVITPSTSSVQFSCSVVSNSLQPYGLQHTRLPCASPTPGAYSNSCPLNLWCHPTISFSAVPFSSCLQLFPASGSFQKRQFFASGGQSTGISASVSVLK